MYGVRKIDEWLLANVFEPFSWWCMYRYGIGHPRLARIVSFLTSLVVMTKQVFEAETNLILIAISLVVSDVCIGRLAEVQASNAIRGANPLRPLWQYRYLLAFALATIYTTMAIANTWVHFAYSVCAPIAYAGAVATVYFTCCDPKPPALRRFLKWQAQRAVTHQT